MIVDPDRSLRHGTQGSERGAKPGCIADFCTPDPSPGGKRGEAGVDFDDDRAGARDRIKRSDRNVATKLMQHPHAGQAGFADLRRAHQIETAIGAQTQLGLTMFDHSEAAHRATEQIPTLAALPEMALCFRVCDETARREMRVVGTEPIDKGPQRGGVGRAFGPAGKIRAGICKREGRRQIKADEHVIAVISPVTKPVQNFCAAPTAIWRDEAH
jgi:hypothetical protein